MNNVATHTATSVTPITPLIRWLITITVMLAAMIEIIDSTIVTVSLNTMGGSLGANTEEISWVVTSYIVAAAIFMPLTGLLVRLMGRKRLLLVNIAGFLLFSVLCGTASTLMEIVIFRVLQGVFGASLVPLSQYILRDTYPPEEHVKAMAIWGMGIMAAPVLGPTIGGYLIDWMNWRWIFYINVPICLLALTMTLLFINDTPREKVAIDWTGLLLMFVAIGTLQIFLDRGNTDDWLSSNFIVALLIIWVGTGLLFITRGLINPKNILNLKIFHDRNYAAACILLVIYTGMIFGILTLQPTIMQTLMNYSTKLSGEMMAPRGIAAALSMMVIAPLSKKIDLRILIAIGISLSAYGIFLYADLPLVNMPLDIIYPSIIQGIGMGFFFVPISTIALSTLRGRELAEGSGMFSFFRNLGTSTGTSIMVTVFTQQTQTGWHSMVSHINPTNPNYIIWQHTVPFSGQTAAAIVSQTIESQSTIIAFNDVAFLSALLMILSLPFIFMIQSPGKNKK